MTTRPRRDADGTRDHMRISSGGKTRLVCCNFTRSRVPFPPAIISIASQCKPPSLPRRTLANADALCVKLVSLALRMRHWTTSPSSMRPERLRGVTHLHPPTLSLHSVPPLHPQLRLRPSNRQKRVPLSQNARKRRYEPSLHCHARAFLTCQTDQEGSRRPYDEGRNAARLPL